MTIITLIPQALAAAPLFAASTISSMASTTTYTGKYFPSPALSTSPHSSSIIIAALPADAAAYSMNSPASKTRLRKRHSKRHSNWFANYNANENSTTLEWSNPCNGAYLPNATSDTRKPSGIRRKEIYTELKRSVGSEYATIKSRHQVIDIEDMQIWLRHNYTYKFLPKMKMNSSIALKRWYRNMQTYVASFAYLHRVQLQWDHSKTQRESPVARELENLLGISRSILCQLETAINDTHPYRPQKKRLPLLTRQQMNQRLKLHTRSRLLRNPQAAPQEADSIDLKFVKYYYCEFLDTMWKVLRRAIKRKGQISLKQEGAAIPASSRIGTSSKKHSSTYNGKTKTYSGGSPTSMASRAGNSNNRNKSPKKNRSTKSRT